MICFRMDNKNNEAWHTRITCGGNQLDYYGETTKHTEGMETMK